MTPSIGDLVLLGDTHLPIQLSHQFSGARDHDLDLLTRIYLTTVSYKAKHWLCRTGLVALCRLKAIRINCILLE
jgi:hypothetical protein